MSETISLNLFNGVATLTRRVSADGNVWFDSTMPTEHGTPALRLSRYEHGAWCVLMDAQRDGWTCSVAFVAKDLDEAAELIERASYAHSIWCDIEAIVTPNETRGAA